MQTCQALRAMGFNGRIIILTVGVNLGFNRRGQGTSSSVENTYKLLFNQLVRTSRELATGLRVEVLDIEALVGMRQETFTHENTNHFYSECATNVNA